MVENSEKPKIKVTCDVSSWPHTTADTVASPCLGQLCGQDRLMVRALAVTVPLPALTPTVRPPSRAFIFQDPNFLVITESTPTSPSKDEDFVSVSSQDFPVSP